tara:strand:+ start:961 stop:1899 length:939 start_codon:yes stop_codon:yes gene_type:complete
MNCSFEQSSQVAIQSKHKAMGGEFVLLAYPQKYLSKADVFDLFKLAFNEVDRIESKFTDFKDSPFNQINDFAPKAPYAVDDEVFKLLESAQDYSKLTDGRFDISFASLVHRQREATHNKSPLSQKATDYYRSVINYKDIELDRKTSSVHFLNKDIRIGFGGIAKGYAVDRAFELLKEAGLVNFSVNGSGDLRVHSSDDAPRPWRLGIRNPFAKDPTAAAGIVQLANGALVTSGTYVNGAHIINKNQSPTQDLVSLTLIEDTAMSADILATALMNMDLNNAISFLDARKSIGIAIDKNGKTHLSQAAIAHFGL